jgi:hypothetical protein
MDPDGSKLMTYTFTFKFLSLDQDIQNVTVEAWGGNFHMAIKRAFSTVKRKHPYSKIPGLTPDEITCRKEK